MYRSIWADPGSELHSLLRVKLVHVLFCVMSKDTDVSKNEHMRENIEEVDNLHEFFAINMQNIAKKVRNVFEMPMTSE